MSQTNVESRQNSGIISGSLSMPGDKSLSHRAFMFGSLALGASHFTNVLSGEDCICTKEAFESMGVRIETISPTEYKIYGNGLKGLKAPQKEIYLGNSGTSIRLLLGILSGQSFSATLSGDPSLSHRPMRRVTDHLKQMGAHIEGADNANYAPLKITGGPLKAIDATLKISSAQVKSAILLAGLYAQGVTSVSEPVRSRDHTELFLKHFGADVRVDGLKVSIYPGHELKASSFEIAGDISSAAFFMALAALTSDEGISFRSILWNPTRIGIVHVLQRMGVVFENLSINHRGPEPVADFKIRKTKLKPFEIKKEELPSLIDEVPILCVLASQASGESVIYDADELRVKETDRIESMTVNLTKMGARIRSEGNTLYISGPCALSGARVDSYKDHRTAMSLIVAGQMALGVTKIEDVECINTSFPNFFELLHKVGGSFDVHRV